MAAPIEVLLTSEVTGQLFNTCVWDPVSGVQLMTFKGGSAAPRTLCLLNRDYLMTAICNKSLLHVWSLQRKDQIQQRMTFPGQINALSTSPDGMYCVAGIEEKLHIWQVPTGDLLAVLRRHYQTINCVRFTDDGGHIISAGEDNLVLVWSLGSVLSSAADPEPRHVWSQHSLPVTDICVGLGAANARVSTSSLDQTVRLWDLTTGEQLCCFVFNHPIMSITMDAAETRLFAGTSTGQICQVNLCQKPVRLERHIGDEEETALSFSGHSKQVGCLDVSLDGALLVSGSHDTTVRVWDIESRQCVRTINHKGAISNVMFMLAPRGLSGDSHKASSPPLRCFKRYLRGSERLAQEQGHFGGVETVSVRPLSELHKTTNNSLPEDCYSEIQQQDGDQATPTTRELSEKVQQLQQKNKELYQFSLSHILPQR